MNDHEARQRKQIKLKKSRREEMTDKGKKKKISELADKHVEKRDEAKSWFFKTFNKREKTNCKYQE